MVPKFFPGFLDLHVHGRRGRDFLYASPRDFCLLARDFLELGVTGLLAGFVSAEAQELSLALESLETAYRADPLVRRVLLGVHFEGPCLAPKKRGAHRARVLRNPDWSWWEPLLEKASFLPRRMITLAPELPGGEALIEALEARGDLVQIGHTEVEGKVATRLLAEHGLGVTHLFNAMPGLHHRQGGLVAAALNDGSRVLVIADGAHVEPEVLRFTLRHLGPRARVVSDSHPLAGLSPGEYQHWEGTYRVGGPGEGLTSEGTLGGSSLPHGEILEFLTELGFSQSEIETWTHHAPFRDLFPEGGPRPEDFENLCPDGAIWGEVQRDAGGRVQAVRYGPEVYAIDALPPIPDFPGSE